MAKLMKSLANQVEKALEGLSEEQLKEVVIAYETNLGNRYW